MEEFKKVLKKRTRFAILYNGVVLIVLASGIIHSTTGSNEHIKDYISGVNFGFCIGIMVLLFYMMGKYQAALKSEEKLKQLYIAENDERSKYIHSQIGGNGLNIITGGLALGTIISGYLNEVVFFSLLGSLMFTVIVKVILKFICSRRY